MPIKTCDSPTTLKTEIDVARKKVSLDETEDTWDTIAQGIVQLTALCNNGGCEFTSDMVAGIRSLSRRLNSAMNSERSRLSGPAIELLTALATGLGSSFEPLVSLLVPTLLALCGRTNKVFTARAKACILAIVEYTQLPSLLPYLAELGTHKSVFPRLTAAEGVLACLNCFNPPDLERDSRARIVEDFIKLTARDASADVRKASKKIFEAYKTLMPGRVERFVAPLTPVVKKYLDIQNAPSGIRALSSASGRQQTSRPPSCANTKATHDAESRHARIPSSNLPTHPLTRAQPPHKELKPIANGPIQGRSLRVPQLATSSRARRDISQRQPRNLLHSSGAAQPHTAQMSACHDAIQRPPPGAARIAPIPSTSAARRPLRPTAMQIKINPPRDQDQVLNAARSVRGARRVPLPAVPMVGVAGEPAPLTTNLVDKAQRSRKQLAKSVEVGSCSKLSEQRPATSAPKKGTESLAKRLQKEVGTSPELLPLPPSPKTTPAAIPLPPSPECIPHRDVVVPDQHPDSPSKTPITALLSSIQQGFLFTPFSPLSPPHTYLPVAGVFPGHVQTHVMVKQVPGDVSPDTSFRRTLKQDFMDVLDSYAPEDLN
ncbi:hypothetical protein BS17DRAFT_878349 [Gyrodon lividus]|nr:hypothetical protein BS17DRAFT_878349 [Gyrodon lividus]